MPRRQAVHQRQLFGAARRGFAVGRLGSSRPLSPTSLTALTAGFLFDSVEQRPQFDRRNPPLCRCGSAVSTVLSENQFFVDYSPSGVAGA